VASVFGFGSSKPPNEGDEKPPAKLSEVIGDDRRFSSPIKKIKTVHSTWRSEVNEQNAVRGAVIVMRDRIGFKYERAIGLDDYVSQKEAAMLLQVPVMTVNRWIRSKTLKSKKKDGFSVLKLRDLLKVVKQQRKRVRIGGTLLTIE
jgi:hypothetical protein